MPLTQEERNKVIRQSILAHRRKSKVGYDGVAVLAHLHSLAGFKDVDKRRVSAEAVKLRNKHWLDGDGASPTVVEEKPGG